MSTITTTTRTCPLTFGEAWSKLDDLQRKSNIPTADIPEVFRDDLKQWIIGRTQVGAFIPDTISGATYCEWLLKVFRKGLYYQVQFKTEPLPTTH